MAKAALKDELTFPAGGIADFYKTDAELEAMDREDAQREFGESGIANFGEVATRMASYGRYGDDTLAHVETGEIVVPKALIDQNPKLKESIFGHLREMGIEDPERYVVGSSENSLNPETGMPEFFLKKIFKGVKKALSGVGKVLKKAAPIILPIALAMTPLGPIYGAALGSGIGTLVQGGSMKDAFKSALIAGASGAVFAGASAKFGGTGTFSEGVSKAFADPGARFSQTLSGAGQTFTGQGLTGQGKLFSEYVPTTPSSATMATQTPAAEVNAATQLSGSGAPTTESGQFMVDQAKAYDAAKMSPYGPDTQALTSESMFTSGVPAEQASLVGGPSPTVTPTETTGLVDTLKGYGDKTMDFLTGADPTQKAIDDYAAKLIADNPSVYVGETGAQLAQQTAKEALSPGFLRTYGPTAALAGAGLYAGGFFDAPEEPPEEEMITGAQLLAQDPGKYSPGGYQVTAAQGPYTVATNYGYVPQPIPAQPPVNPFLRPIGVAEGGEIFPRRVGGIMPNEGIPGQDSVRAMLMPGEFVMTTNAVKGLGNGNNQVGINRMYDMMRGLEAKGKAMA
jgi:hypothetical protein